MNRRTLLTAGTALIGSTVIGCVENRGSMGNSNNIGENTEPTDTETSDPSNRDISDNRTNSDSSYSDNNETNDQSAICETHFEIINEWDDKEESASVTFDEGTVTVSGIIMGRGGCYTARLNETKIEDERLIVRIESYDDSEEDEACTGALIFIEYKSTITVNGDPPKVVQVEHNDETVTTEQLP